MVNIQDGSLVPASALLNGEGEDPDNIEGKLKFAAVKDATYPTFQAKAKMNDGSGRTRIYTFSLGETNVTVHVAQIIEKEEEEEEEVKAAAATIKTEKVVHETKIPESKKSNAPADYRLAAAQGENKR